jgi:hypothetical protein
VSGGQALDQRRHRVAGAGALGAPVGGAEDHRRRLVQRSEDQVRERGRIGRFDLPGLDPRGDQARAAAVTRGRPPTA